MPLRKISLEQITKSFGKRRIVKGVDLNFAQGEVVGLLGGNGAGKTTTFYMITGLDKPDSGEVFLDDEPITNLPMHKRARRGIAYLPQENSVFRGLSVEDNLYLVMEQSGVSRAEQSKRVASLLDEFGLHRVRNSKGLQLSGGEKRRVELARALAAGIEEPRFLLLDEPFAGVDPITVGDIQELIKQLKDRGMGIFITDHSVGATLAITDRAYIMHEGEILADGVPEDLAKNPKVRKFYLGETFKL
ncbi:MAG: LPS export ABC transporter ATP-binding protein [Gloeobacterales cyanobacterium]